MNEWPSGMIGKFMIRFVTTSLWLAALVSVGHPNTAIEIKGKTCIEAGCHDTIQSQAVVHGPVAQGKCRPCHEEIGPETHRFQPMPTADKLCQSCHITQLKNFVHQPVREGQCTQCHDPHQSEHRFMLLENP